MKLKVEEDNPGISDNGINGDADNNFQLQLVTPQLEEENGHDSNYENFNGNHYADSNSIDKEDGGDDEDVSSSSSSTCNVVSDISVIQSYFSSDPSVIRPKRFKLSPLNLNKGNDEEEDDDNPTTETSTQFKRVQINGKYIYVLDDKSLRKDIDHCLTCGSFALRQEFYKHHFCVESCYKSSPQWLEEQQQLNAPIKLFKQPALPSDPNPFKAGQMMEAIDPENQSLFCVVSIEKVQGWRLLIHFEGFSNHFDFWVNCDSLDIFPPGWCAENGYFLQPPGDYFPNKPFNWHSYLIRKGKDPAPRHFFQITKELEDPSTGPGLLDNELVGCKLEAVDIRAIATNFTICVATVTKVLGHRFLVHFDSWDNIYDFWADSFSSPFVFPVGHCERNGLTITPPNGFEEDFNWPTYLKLTESWAMPAHLFQPLPPVGFKRGMRVECVDMRNRHLIRPAVIQSSEGHMVTIRYEGWPETYDIKINEMSDDLHPVGYCETTDHPLERHPPKLGNKTICPYLCEMKGNVAEPTEKTHINKTECPYLVEREKSERVVILINSDGVPGSSTVVRPQPPSPSSGFSILPGSGLVQYSNRRRSLCDYQYPPPPVNKVRKGDIFAKMMSLAQTVLQEERVNTDIFLFEEIIDDLTPEIICEWNEDQVFDFICSLPNCMSLARNMKEQLVDGDALLLLRKQDFVTMSDGDVHWMKVAYVLHVIKRKFEEPVKMEVELDLEYFE